MSPLESRAAPRRLHWLWIALLFALVAVRLPSLVQPAGGDQGLYVYAGQRILAGDIMYRDVWDQKPPAIAFLYATLSGLWPDESVVPAADLAAAAGIAALLVALGRRRYSVTIGCGAAAIFLLLGDPYLQRMSGVYVRGQCEPFMALAITAGVVLLGDLDRRRPHLLAAGVVLAVAFWLKYNSAAYLLPLTVASWVWASRAGWDRRQTLRDLSWIALGFALVSAAVLMYFAVNGAVVDLRLATVDYNLRYSNETYESPFAVPLYVLTMPLERARVDMLWFLGGLGALLLAWRGREDRSTVVALAWLAGAVLSIAINGSRGLPNYFVQAAPALALCASAGLATLHGRRRWIHYTVGVLLLAGLWRVGADAPTWGLRLASLPGLVENLRYDLSYVRGELDRDTYLHRFQGVKFDAFEIDRLARRVAATTAPGEHVFVFGFSGGSVGWKSARESSSRFYWSRPVIIEFAAGRQGYGSAGLLEDLEQHPPVLVALQKDEWRSRDHFLTKPHLRRWLEAAYVADHETPMFAVWRRRP